MVSLLEVSTITLSGFHASPIASALRSSPCDSARVFGHVRFERDARAFEEDHAVRPVVFRGVAIVRVVEGCEILGDAHRVSPRVDVLEHSGIPDALFTFAVGAMVVEVAELTQERAFPHPGPPTIATRMPNNKWGQTPFLRFS